MDGISFSWGIERTETGMAAVGDKRPKVIDMRAVAAELVAMTMFVIIGCGVACGYRGSDGHLQIAFAFGMAILVLAYTIGHHSGGHINCAVTFSLVVGGQVPWYQGVANFLAQLLGSVLGAIFLCILFPCEDDHTAGTLGSNVVTPRESGRAFGCFFRALLGEMFGTCLLCYVVWETAVSKKATVGQNACIAIGFAVFLAHLLLLPIDGCSINPTRSFGPAVVSAIRNCNEMSTKGLEDLWVMWVGPLLGALVATALQRPFVRGDSKNDSVLPVTDTVLPMEK